MNHEIIKQIIFEQREIIKNVKIVKRDYSFEKEANYILVGLRRAGKSTLLYKIARDIVEQGADWEQIIYINFEDERLIEFTVNDFNDIVQTAGELTMKKAYYFLDEVQNIEGWEKFARRMADAGERIYITGGNATMLSQEMSARLGGRFWTKKIMPYSFKEYLDALQVSYNDEAMYNARKNGLIRKSAKDYLMEGGFPESLNFIDKRGYVENIYQKVLLGDIAGRYAIRNVKGLKVLLKKIAETITSEVSYTKLYNTVKSVGVQCSKDSIISYTGYAINAYLIFETKNYIAKFMESETTPRFYFNDNGLLNLFLVNKNSLLLENIVATHLNRKYTDDLFYFKSLKIGIDVDFYIPNSSMAVQVTYTLNEGNVDREINSLVALSKWDNEKVESYMIVTYEDNEKIIEIEGISIAVLPLYKFLLM